MCVCDACWRLSSSIVVCNTSGPRNLTHQGAARDGGPVVLRSAGTGMGDRLRTGIPPKPTASEEYRQDVSFHPWINVWWQVKLCDPSLTLSILSAVEVSSHEKALYKCPVFSIFNFSMYSVRVAFFRLI